jgi:hypothetical protein
MFYMFKTSSEEIKKNVDALIVSMTKGLVETESVEESSNAIDDDDEAG